MNNLVILSRDHLEYKTLIESANLANLQVLASSNKLQTLNHIEDANILLAEPDLAAELVSKSHNLNWLQSTWAGVKPLLDRPNLNFTITGIKHVFGIQMREYVFTYLLHFSRKVAEFTALQEQGKWLGTEVVTDSLYGKNLGIIGVGSIGVEVAKLAKQFGMQVIGLSRVNGNCEYVDRFFTPADLNIFARQLDYCVCLLPHTAQTNSMLGEGFFSNLSSHSVFINAGRGQVVDHDALISALEKKQLAGAVLDVFPEEPLTINSRLWKTKNVIITQHTSAISKPKDIAKIFIENYKNYLNGDKLNFVIDPSKGY